MIRATIAFPGLFPGVKIGPDLIHQVDISGEVGWNNPSHDVVKEFESQWNRQNMACLANIGTGHQGVTRIKEVDGSIVPSSLEVMLERVATDSERVVDEIAHRFEAQKTYYRLSVEQGLGSKDWSEPITLETIATHTNSYLSLFDVSISLDALVASLLDSQEVPSRSITKKHFEEVTNSSALTAKERVDKPQTNEIKEAVLGLGSDRLN